MAIRIIKMKAWDCAITFVVDTDVLNQDNLQDMHEFWHGHEQGLEEFKGDMLHAVLSNVARVALTGQFNMGYNIFGLVSQFDYDDGEGIEGYCKMDGSMGIKIVSYEELSIGDFTAHETVVSSEDTLPK